MINTIERKIEYISKKRKNFINYLYDKIFVIYIYIYIIKIFELKKNQGGLSL